VAVALQGALGRFINHSCEPNCETQKWLVQGELAIGLFTQRSIRAGEELTFDYNFERYGDKVGRTFRDRRVSRPELSTSTQLQRLYVGGQADAWRTFHWTHGPRSSTCCPCSRERWIRLGRPR